MIRVQKGLTLVELVMAMALFSFVLLIIISGTVNLYKIYRAGVGIRDTQQQARTISEEITRSTREASQVIVNASNDAVCLVNSSTIRIYTIDGAQPLNASIVTGTRTSADLSTCDKNDFSPLRQVTSSDVSPAFFRVFASAVGAASNQTILDYDFRLVSTRTLTGEFDSNPADPRCFDGRPFCSMTSISSTAQARSQIKAED